VGATDAKGFLTNVDDLVKRGIVTATATITLPAFDVDEHTFPELDCDEDEINDDLQPEVDNVSLNDQLIGTLKGDNEIWVSQSFEVPISRLRFPSSPGATAVNRFRIDIDVANQNVSLSGGGHGCRVWAVAIDWIGVKFEASAPVVMVHGIRSNGSAFDNFKSGLAAERVAAADNTISLTDTPAPDPIPTGCPSIAYNNTYADHTQQLLTSIPAIAAKFGSEALHYVTHSKGGLDVRAFLSKTVANPIRVRVGTMGNQPVTRDLEARSLVTLDTPYGGSVLASYGVEARQLTWPQAVRNGINPSAAKGLEGSYYCDLTPPRATALVATTTLPSGLQTGSVASDADCNGNEHIDDQPLCAPGRAEGTGFTLNTFGAADRLYRLVGGVSDVKITVTRRRFLPDQVTITETPTTSFLGNDAVVTQDSAGLYQRYSITGWHHLNVHSRENAQAIARDAQKGGIVDWRLR
jgi:hypothetical protein